MWGYSQEEWAEMKHLGDQGGGRCSGGTQYCWASFREQGKDGDGDVPWKNEGRTKSIQRFLLVNARVGFGVR